MSAVANPAYDIDKIRTLAKRVLRISKQGLHTAGMAVAHTEAHLAFDEAANPVAVLALLDDFAKLVRENASLRVAKEVLALRDKQLRRAIETLEELLGQVGEDNKGILCDSHDMLKRARATLVAIRKGTQG